MHKMKTSKEYSAALNNTLEYALNYLNELDSDCVSAYKSLDTLRSDLNKPLNANRETAEKVINELIKDAEGGLINSAGGRFFAWVIGGSIPAALAADWLTSVWDQNAALYASSPSEAVIEEIVGDWLKEILRKRLLKLRKMTNTLTLTLTLFIFIDYYLKVYSKIIF